MLRAVKGTRARGRWILLLRRRHPRLRDRRSLGNDRLLRRRQHRHHLRARPVPALLLDPLDLVVLLLEGCERPGRGDAFIVNLLRQQPLPVLVALNKWDKVPEERQEESASAYSALLSETAWPVHRCSALAGDGCTALTQAMADQLPRGPQLYPPEMVSDQPERVLMGELIREQVLLHTREEIPHSVAVTIDRVEELPAGGKGGGRTAVLATVMVERKSQKGILIGKGGAMLKTIGQGARLQMQTLIDGPVYLELFVKVVPDWRSKPARLAELGYGVES